MHRARSECCSTTADLLGRGLQAQLARTALPGVCCVQQQQGGCAQPNWCRSSAVLRAYHELRGVVGAGDFWSYATPELKESQQILSRATSSVSRFLSLTPDDPEAELKKAWKRVWLENDAGVWTSLGEITRAYNAFEDAHVPLAAQKRETIDRNTMVRLGYTVKDKVNVCTGCVMKAPKPKVCCALHGRKRTKHVAVANVRLRSASMFTGPTDE